jgi:AraC family transcriptional regulator
MEQPRIEIVEDLKLLGQRVRMSFANNQTQNLFKGFMPRKKEIKNSVGLEVYSVEIYDNNLFFKTFDPTKEFEKWAAVKVSDYNNVPEEMHSLIIPTGEYAVFNYKGDGSDISDTYEYIISESIPNSAYRLDHRPHFAVMGEKYKNGDPASEEELWFPIKKK